MKRLIQTFACLGLATGSISNPALAQTQDDRPDAETDLGPVLERLDQVIVGLAKVSGNLSKLQNDSRDNAKDHSLKTTSKQLRDINAAVESLTRQLVGQANSAETTAKLLGQLLDLQTAAAARAKQPAAKPKWEYKSIFGDSRVALEEEMNLFGRDGWEFFNITSFGRGTAAFARRRAK